MKFMTRKLFLVLITLTSINAFSSAFAQQPSNMPPVNEVITPPTTTGNPQPSPQQQMSLSQFQQWLQSNGYSQNQAGAGVSGSGNMPPGNPPPPPKKTQRPLTYEESQQVMLDTVRSPNTTPNPDADIAFNSMLQQNMPLTPEQVVQLRQQIDTAQRAAAVTPNIPPKPVSTTVMINLAPGTTPPAIRLAQGYVSSLVFVDSTGSPWPIASFDIGMPKAVNMQWDGKSNILLIQAVSPYMDGNMVVKLVGLPTPITLELVSGQRVVDYRVDIHVSGIGPNTKELPIGTALPNSASQLLLGVLDGVAPPGSKTLSVLGADAQAWLLGEKIYFRTRLTVLSPGWIGKMSSPDGMMAYELPKTSSILVSRYGAPAEIKIGGF